MPHPPSLPLRFFRWFCNPRMLDYIEGDLMEVYERRVKASGKRTADFRFALDVLLLFRPGIVRKMEMYQPQTNYSMYRSYFKIAYRTLVKNKGYSAINISGLAVGMAVALLIGLWVFDEVSFDSYFENRDQLAQVMVNQTHEGVTYTGETIQMPLGSALRTGFASDFKSLSLASRRSDYSLKNGENKISANGMWVQEEFPEMFTFTMLSGNRGALKDPSTILISSSMSEALFGKGDPINQTIRIDDKLEMVIGGVFEDLPFNTRFKGLQVLMPWENSANWLNKQSDWTNHNGQLYVQLADGVNLEVLNEEIRAVPSPHIGQWKEEAMLQTLDRAHLYSKFENGKEAGGRIQFVRLFGAIGIFVLVLACINFINLSTARSEKRAKEVGIRKTVGSMRSQLINQFLSESVMVACLSAVIALILVELSLPFFNTMADKEISLPWFDPLFWAAMLGFNLFTGLISGSYPAFFLSGFRPIKILKGTLTLNRWAHLPRKVLVVAQFTVSTTLIIGTLIVYQQVQYAKDRETGYSRDGLITVWINTDELRKNVDVIRNELVQGGIIENLALSSQSPAHFGNNNGMDWRGKDPGFVLFFRNVGVSPEFGNTIGWTINRGRDFSANMPGDSSAMIINESTAEVLGFEDPLGEIVTFHGKQYSIIGVAEDILTQSPYEPNAPSFFVTDDWMGLVVMRLNPALPLRESLKGVESTFKRYNPESPFHFSFVDEEFARKYAIEERVGNLAGVFAILAVFISCLGLFGLASFVVEQRTKEIGIRKVMGASVISLWQMLSKDFVKLVVIACALAIPISNYFMEEWLRQYQYRTVISWNIFLFTLAGALAITLLTVSFQAISAALMNPVKSLKSE